MKITTDTVTAFAPATVANLGPGFDILGMAIQGLGDRVTVRRTNVVTGIEVADITGDDGRLPRDPDQNTAAIAAREVLQALEAGVDVGLSISIEKGLPLASGLGSSAASAVAAAVATNALFDNLLRRSELLPACLEAEAAVSGRHADNVAPALLGGIVLVGGTQLDDLHSLPIPPNLYLGLVTPQAEVPTAQARSVLPQTVLLQQAVHQARAVAQLIHALHTNDVDLLIEAMVQDIIVEPARKSLIPYYEEAQAEALDNGAQGVIISGGGPTLCLLADRAEDIQRSGEAAVALYATHDIPATLHLSQPSAQGAFVEEEL